MMADTIYTPLLYGGFLSIVALALAEKLVPVIPSYALLIFLGTTHASDTKGFISTVAASALGSMLGTLVWYGVGRLAGRNRIEVWIDKGGRYVFLPWRDIEHWRNSMKGIRSGSRSPHRRSQPSASSWRCRPACSD
jgi:alkaline phosphatase